MFSVLHIVFFIHNLNIFQLLRLSIDVFCTYTFYLKPTEARRHFAKTLVQRWFHYTQSVLYNHDQPSHYTLNAPIKYYPIELTIP